MNDQSHIRNFCIIAHIDHGKSTLADRMLELTGTVTKREMQDQLLDTMELEREKGITIKLQPVQMGWQVSGARSTSSTAPGAAHRTEEYASGPVSTTPAQSSLQTHSMVTGTGEASMEARGDEAQGPGEHRSGVYSDIHRVRSTASNDEIRDTNFQLNLIDTPGHVDFSYEVSRSLAACEGAILVVDASQGIQAQTLANVYLAIEAGLEIIPVLNKIDLPAADPERVTGEIVNLLGCRPEEILRVSAKEGTGVPELLDAVVARVPAPSGGEAQPLRALVFDSVYDAYRGVILYVRIVDGELAKGAGIRLIGSRQEGLAIETGVLKPAQTAVPKLATGQIGYMVTNLKSVSEARVGDTITLTTRPASTPLPGYKQAKPFVFAGFFPSSAEQYPALKEALEKLKLNDAALVYTPETSQVLGFGYRVGFLGLLHLDIIRERLEREYGLEIVATNPSTDYIVHTTDGTSITIRSAAELPDPSKILNVEEPWIKGEVVVPGDYVGGVIQLINQVRGHQTNLSYADETLAIVSFEAPLAGVLTDFYDSLKNVTSGYGSFNYELSEYRVENLVRLDILVGGEMVDSLSLVVHRDDAYRLGKQIVEKLKDVIPRQLFEVSLQAAIGGKIIAREDIKALGKNVTAKLYGGDVTRKNKLLDKQKKGKKKMKRIGKVDIPSEAFMVLVKRD